MKAKKRKEEQRPEAAPDAGSQEEATGEADTIHEGDAVEVEVVDTDAEVHERPDEASIDELREQLAEAHREIGELKDKWLRAGAELQNTRKRAARELQDMQVRAGERILKQLLEPADNLARAIESGKSESSSEEAGYDAMLRGIEMTYGQLMDVLEREQVTLMKTVGETFDPMKHEAMMAVEHDEAPDGVIVEEMSRGYELGDRVLRHARVIVSKGPGSDNSPDDSARNDDNNNDTDNE